MLKKFVRASVRPVVCCLISCLALSVAAPRLVSAEKEQLPYPRMSESVIEMLKRFYYDHDRFHPTLMLQRALRAIETTEMSVDVELKKDRIDFNFSGEKSSLEIKEPKNIGDLTDIFARLQELLLKRVEYDDDERSNMVYAMYNGALQTLDPHTVIFPPKPASDFQDDLEGEFFGIGAYLSQEDGLVKIDRVMPGRPAEKAGVQDGDKIVRVDGEKTAGLSLSESVSRIKGPRNTKVALTIEREGEKDLIVIEVVRDLVRVEVLQAHRQGDIAYVRLDEFNKNADKMLRDVLYAWDRDMDNPVMGLVLDLRFNGGGRLDKAKIISDMFLPSEKEIVRTVSKGQKPYIQNSSKDNISILDVPMLVLVSPSSASAAEILAGALQQNNRAAVIGRTSYGKGSVQQYRPLKNQSIFKFTVQEYQLKDGVSIQGVGIMPDIELLRHGIKENGSVDLLPFSRSSESDAEFALKSHDNYVHNAAYHLSWLAEYEDLESLRKHYISAGPKFSPDQEAQLAMDLIAAALKTPEAEAKLSEANLGNYGDLIIDLVKQPVAERAKQEAEDLAKALANHGAVAKWGAIDAFNADAISLRFAGPMTLHGGVKEGLKFEVSNVGDVDVGRLYAVIRRDREDPSSPFWEEEILIGSVAPKGVAHGSMAYRVPPRLFTGKERLVADLYQQGRKDVIASTSVQVDIVNDSRPVFNVSWKLESEDGRIQKDRQEKLVITIKNEGNTSSAPVTLLMSKSDNRFVQLGEGRWKLEAIEAGAEQVVEVPLTILSVLALRTKKIVNKENKIELDLFIEEQFEEAGIGQYREGLSYRFDLPLDVEITGGVLRKPVMTLASVSADEKDLHIQVKIEDDNLDFVTAFLNKDKVKLSTFAEIVDGIFTLQVPLHKGLNQVQVLARDSDHLVRYLPVRFWSEHGIEEVLKKTVPTAALQSTETDDVGHDDIP